MIWLCFSGRVKPFALYFGDKFQVLPSVGASLDHCAPFFYLPISVPLTLFSIPVIQLSTVLLPVLSPALDSELHDGFLSGPSTPRQQRQKSVHLHMAVYAHLGPSASVLVGEARLVRRDSVLKAGALDMSWLCLLLGSAVVSGSYDLGERKEFWHFLGTNSFFWQPYQEGRFEIISVEPECPRISLWLKSMCLLS